MSDDLKKLEAKLLQGKWLTRGHRGIKYNKEKQKWIGYRDYLEGQLFKQMETDKLEDAIKWLESN